MSLLIFALNEMFLRVGFCMKIASTYSFKFI